MASEHHTMTSNYLELRSFAYDVLRQVFLQEPTKDLLQSIEKGQYLREFPFIHENFHIEEGVKNVTVFFKEHDIDEIYDQLHWDYTRMFIGPYELPAPLWESAYVNDERLLFQSETLVVRQAYLKLFSPCSLWSGSR